jgi:hypothetical protein
MPPPSKTRDLARSLLAGEADAKTTRVQTEPATVRFYQRLQRVVCACAGADSFRAIACRALFLATAESPSLSAVQVSADGCLRGLREVESEQDTDQDDGAGVILIAQLLDLFLTFLGEATTLKLIEDLRIQVEVRTETGAVTADATSQGAAAPALVKSSGDLLQEIDRLREVSERIEVLADQHPGMEDGLASIAGNIRSIAVVLNIFMLIRGKSESLQEDTLVQQSAPYVM